MFEAQNAFAPYSSDSCGKQKEIEGQENDGLL